MLAVIVASLGVPAMAQDLTTEEIIQQLRPSGKTRSLSENRGIKVEGKDLVETEASINLYINFDYNSAALRQDALITLDRLAAALKDQRLASLDFLIGGHTDAKGSDAFNLGLSERRARAVKDYLVQRHGISATMLIDKGFGEARLLDKANPLDGQSARSSHDIGYSRNRIARVARGGRSLVERVLQESHRTR